MEEKKEENNSLIIPHSGDSEDFLACSNMEGVIFADLHIHSRFSRACSKNLDIPNLVKWARIKGIGLLGTGDFTHNEWLAEIKQLKEENGVYWYNSNTKPDEKDFPFILSSEISLVYSQNGKGRRVHLVYLAPNLETVNKINAWLDTKGRRDYDGRPIFKISCRDFAAKMEEIDSRIEVIPAHIWTPWFGIFGSKGGFDSLKEAFEDKVYLIHGIETGISSDPLMNWKIRDLNKISIVSFSDSHSFWPWRLGREATIFRLKEGEKLSYDSIIKQIRENSFIGTVETDPCYGMYHFDGHRNCNFSCSPSETLKLNKICPVCKKGLTVGVEYRVDELAKCAEANHENKKCYFRLLPLHEIISLGLGIGVNSKGSWKIYNELIDKFQTEFNVLLNISNSEINKVIQNKTVSDLIILNREGKINVRPGYDGTYGKAIIGGKESEICSESQDPENSKIAREKSLQKKLF
ncbi:MAG: endonuclease Q family protein [Candidatus Pacearchaeota archaeon]|jgi:uncharacterized protein (TIGR00375 family)